MKMDLASALQHKIDLKTKPVGSLGMLEDVAHQIGLIQNTQQPELLHPVILVFAGDHGIAREGVSAYPQEVTHQMVLNFLNGGAGINVFARQHNIELQVIDAGVNHDFVPQEGLRNRKVGFGTDNFLKVAAMSRDDYERCIHYGRELVCEIADKGTNVIGFGEMGIGNTSAASMLMSYLCDVPLKDCIGRGTGLCDEQMMHKMAVLQAAKAFHGDIQDPEGVLQTFGGFEMVQMCGAMLAAFERNMLILVDGFISTSVFLAANKINPGVTRNALFCHQSNESGHAQLLSYLHATPILNLGLRLGEGTGCALAYPIIESAVRFLNDMASFEEAGVSNKA